MSLYDEAAGCELDHHESDLYVKATPESSKIMRGYDDLTSMFCSAADGSLWYDVPFMWEPFWRRAGGRS